jgi:DNA primase
MNSNPATQVRRRLIDAKALCVALGLTMARGSTSRQATVLCPWHAERTPSCSVRIAKDSTIAVKCHACGSTADALGLIAAVEGLRSFPDVLKRAAELANAPDLADTIEAKRPPRDEAEGVSDEDYLSIWTFLLDALSPLSAVSPSVASYLDGRGIYADAEAVGVCGLPRDTRPPIAALLATFDRSQLERAGVLRRGHDAFDWSQWSLCIPWRSRFGRIDVVQRRRLEEIKPKYRFPADRAPRAPFGVDLLGDALESQGPNAEIVITEGALDCLARRRIARHRKERAAVIGVSSSSSPCVGLPLDLLAGRTIVLALDADKPGDCACALLESQLRGVAGALVRERPNGSKDWGAALVEGAA